MSENAQNISVELPAHLLEKLGNDPANKILELVEKYIDEEHGKPARVPAPAF